jgi:beta-mannosidase
MKHIDLAGTWQLSRKGKKESIKATIPGDNYSALIAAGLMKDPYVGTQELDAQWAGREDWIFEKAFVLSAQAANAPAAFINLDSVDTIATVELNGKKLGETDNMFARLRYDVAGLLKEGENTLTVSVKSAVVEAAARAKKLTYPVPTSTAPVSEPYRNLVRKVPCHAGWDWGPCLMVSGIYGGAYLGLARQGRIEYVTTEMKRRGEAWTVSVTAELCAAKDGEVSVQATVGTETVTKDFRLSKGFNSVTIPVVVKKPELWWPNGYGAQPLYDLSVKALGDEAKKKIGFRELEVVTKADKIGRSLIFRVNGRDVFCKGADWIPIDALPARETRVRYAKLIESAVAANMNMIRVWGGGKYESDDFYELCDEKGIMLWHDFMFACSLYPSNPEFLGSAEREIRHQVKRLKDHPSIALWCGDNENIGALNWFPESRANRDRYIIDYDRLNSGVISKVVAELDPARTFWPSSPCAGPGDFADNWHADGKGDMHYWSVWHEGKPFEAYYDILPRFVSEFGYQSFPSLDTVKGYASADQFNLTSPVMEHHQKNLRGNSIISENFSRYFRLPEGFANMLYLSQVQQALAMKTGVEYWRSKRPVCMGAIYWQLNDNWPVASWASIEYSGKWKLLHYVARRFFGNVGVFAYNGKDGSVQVWGVNDTDKPAAGNLRLAFVDFSGKTVSEKKLQATIAPDSAVLLAEFPINKLPCSRNEAFLSVRFEGKGYALENELFLTEQKRCALEKATVSVEVAEGPTGPVVTLKTDKPAFYVSLDAEGIPGCFDDNCFTLLPGAARKLVFSYEGRGKLTATKLQRKLKVYDLRSTYR